MTIYLVLLYPKNECINWAYFFQTNCDAIILIRTTSYSISFLYLSLLNTNLLQLYLLDPQWWLEGSYEIRSADSFILPCGCFLGIWLWDFTEFLHCARNPYEIVCDRTRIFGRNVFFAFFFIKIIFCNVTRTVQVSLPACGYFRCYSVKCISCFMLRFLMTSWNLRS